jgi:hypothetical protein
MHVRTILTAAAMASTFTIGVASALAQEEAREEFSLTPTAGGATALDVTNLNGAIHVIGTDDGPISIMGEKITKSTTGDEARAALADITIRTSTASGTLVVESVHPSERGNTQYNVHYTIRIPRDWSVVAKNRNGAIEVEGINAAVTASVSNGQVTTKQVSGNVTASVSNGQIDGDLDVPSGGALSLTVDNGQIRSRVGLSGAADCTVRATNGEVDLTLDDDASARLDAEVEVGSVDVSSLSMTSATRTKRGMVGESVSGTIGGGAATVGVTVSTGSVRVGR